MTMPSEGEKLIDLLIVEAVRYVEQLVERVVRDSFEGSGAGAGAESLLSDDSWKLVLRKTIESNTAANSPVMELFVKRSYELMMRGLIPSLSSSSSGACVASDLAPTLSKFSMHSAQQASAVKALVDKARRLLSHHVRVHGGTYSTMLQSIKYAIGSGPSSDPV